LKGKKKTKRLTLVLSATLKRQKKGFCCQKNLKGKTQGKEKGSPRIVQLIYHKQEIASGPTKGANGREMNKINTLLLQKRAGKTVFFLP